MKLFETHIYRNSISKSITFDNSLFMTLYILYSFFALVTVLFALRPKSDTIETVMKNSAIIT